MVSVDMGSSKPASPVSSDRRDSLGRVSPSEKQSEADATRVEGVEAVVAAAVKESPTHIQERTVRGMGLVLDGLWAGESARGAAARASVSDYTVKGWRQKYPTFDLEVRRLLTRNKRAREQAIRMEAAERRERDGLIIREATPPARGSFTDFRWKYFGRPTPEHQETAVMALEDDSNLYTFIFGPTGMGKDTMAGDYVAYESAPDRTGLRVAWFMETGPFSSRRMKRLDRYLTDPTSYRHAPEKTPGGQVPSGSLIEDYGPFKWEPDMIWEDGTEVERTQWNSVEKYYVRTVAPEQDPNLWATGVQGAAYGSRIGLCVCSDMFTKENQQSPTERKNQFEWLDGTLDTRLDEDGRLVVIGTWLPVENNYERILEAYVEDAHVIREVTVGPGTYTKYSNGVAVVIIKAIYPDPETGEELSYWPDRFPLSDQLVHKKTRDRILVDDIPDSRVLELQDSGEWKRVRGLKSKRARSPIVFKAMYQQERDKDNTVADFTTETLERAHDETRQFGQVFSHEIKVLGVDPARRYGAGWVLWAVDKSTGTMTMADFWWGEKLGYTGVKDLLVLKPLARYDPSWLCYEVNRDGELLGDTTIYRALESAGVSVYPHRTGLERGHAEYGPGALAAWMRDGRIKIPYMTAADKARAMDLESHFKAWDGSPERSKAGQAGHKPDDLAMAAWVGWMKAGPMIERGNNRDLNLNIGVPLAIRRKFDRSKKAAQAMVAAKNRESPRDVLVRGNPLDMLRHFVDED